MSNILSRIKAIIQETVASRIINDLRTEIVELKRQINDFETQMEQLRTDKLIFDRMWNSDITFYVMNLDKELKALNPKARKTLGIGDMDISTMRMDDLLDKEYNESNQAHLDKLIRQNQETGRNDMLQFVFKGVENQPIITALTGYFIPERDEIIGTIIDMKDFSLSFAFSEEFYKNMPVATCLIREKTKTFSTVSDRFYQLTGYSDEEIQGRKLDEVALFLTDKDNSNFLEQIAGKGEFNDVEVKIKTRDGNIRNCIGSGFSFEMNAESYILFSAIDITFQKEVEQALRVSRELNTTLLNTTPDLMTLLKPDGTIIEVNQPVADRMGISKDELIGQNLIELFPSNIREQRKEVTRKVVQMRQPSHHIDYDEYLDITFDTHMYPILNDEGEVIQLAIYSRDITEQNSQETLLRNLRNLLDTIINSMPSIIISVDQNKQVTNWNKEAERITGISSEKAIGEYILDVFPVLSQFATNIDDAVFNLDQQTLNKKSIIWNDQTVFWTINLYPLKAEKIQGAAIRIDDVTKGVEMEQLLIQTEKMMTVGGLAAGMAHELNNPLASIVQSVQNITRRLSPDFDKNLEVANQLNVDLNLFSEYLEKRKITNYLTAIEESGKRAASIISNMLQFSRKSNKDKQVAEINTIVEGALNLIRNDYNIKKRIDSKKINFIQQLQQGLPPIPCIETEIQQVILNLLKNASDALFESKNKQPEIRIETKMVDESIVIEIADNGPGIPDEIRQKIFEPFYTTKPVGKGTGLGLSVSYMIITQNHGGSLNVMSAIDQGTTFTIVLPIRA